MNSFSEMFMKNRRKINEIIDDDINLWPTIKQKSRYFRGGGGCVEGKRKN